MAARAHHNTAQVIALGNYTTEHYVESGLSDIDFADAAGAELGFPVSAAQVKKTREALNIANNLKAAQEAKAGGGVAQLEARVAQLEADNAELREGLASLLVRFDELFAEASGAMFEVTQELPPIKLPAELGDTPAG